LAFHFRLDLGGSGFSNYPDAAADEQAKQDQDNASPEFIQLTEEAGRQTFSRLQEESFESGNNFVFRFGDLFLVMIFIAILVVGLTGAEVGLHTIPDHAENVGFE